MESEHSMPLVSVCIPAYNHEKYVGECIQSAIDQDYENIELIIINDGSKDNTHDVIMNYVDKCKERFIRFEYRSRENKGLTTTLNEIVEWSQGKYFTGVASDDVMFLNKVSLLVEELEKLDDSYVVAFGNAIFIDNNSEEIYLNLNTGMPTAKENGFNLFLDYYTKNRNFDYKDKNAFGSYETLLTGNYLPAMSYVMKLDKIKEVGAWTNGNTIEDWEMWLKLSKKYKFFYVDNIVAKYRMHDSNITKLKILQLHIDGMELLQENRTYCIDNKIEKVWEESYLNLLTYFFHYERLKLFVEYLNHLSIFLKFRFTVKIILKKFVNLVKKFVNLSLKK